MSELTKEEIEEKKRYNRWYKNHLENKKIEKKRAAGVTPEKAAIIKLMSKEPAPHTQPWFYHNYAPQTTDSSPHEIGEYRR